MTSTPLQTATYSTPVYADMAATMGGGTPLIVAVCKTGRTDECQVLVKLQLLEAYERAIFELQQQLSHYRVLIDVLLPKQVAPDELRLDQISLNAASVGVLESITNMRVSETALRGLDEPDASPAPAAAPR
jgi:hypothetical protein